MVVMRQVNQSRRNNFPLKIIIVIGLVQLHILVLSVKSKECSGDAPTISFAFFNETGTETKGPPHLYNVSSEDEVMVEEGIRFPYQFILMTCSAPYPVQWIKDEDLLPKHYFFSYILDDETRSVRDVETFTILLHMGNETFVKPNFSNVSATCVPVEPERRNCTGVVVTISKFDSGDPHHIELGAKFNEVKSFERKKYDDPKSRCIRWFGNASNFDEQLDCQPTPDEESNDVNLTLKYNIRLNTSLLTMPQGMLECEPASLTRMESGLKPYKLRYFFSLPKLCPNENLRLPHLYFVNGSTEEVDKCLGPEEESDFLSLCIRNQILDDDTFYVGDNITVTCISSIFYFASGIRIHQIRPGYNDTVPHSMSSEQANGVGGFRNLTEFFVLNNSTTFELECLAPIRKSRRWVSKSATIHVNTPVIPKFQSTPETILHNNSDIFLLCNASGSPLPSLTWSRLNNGKMPKNETILKAPNSSWISSKLHFPPSTSPEFLEEYYGRYICTATNRFESIERVFLVDENIETSDFSLSSVWFWGIIGLSMLLLIGIIVFLGWRLQNQGKNLRLFTASEIDEFLFGKPEMLIGGEYEEINSYATYLPYDRYKFEIKKEQLKFDPKDVLGTGAYGTVYKGLFQDKEGECMEVAIKTVNASSDKLYFAALLSEIKIMCYIGKHGNIVELIGACTKYLDQRQIFVATEFCSNGDLLNYIQRHQNTFRNNSSLAGEHKREELRKKSVGKPGRKPGSNGYCRLAYARLLLSPHLLLVWALQISQGMSFLSSKKVIHGDLAARNILLASDLKPKIGDFGLSKRMQNYSSYVRNQDDFLPWRWLSIECLQFMKFSIKSDCWAFGVLLYEMFSLGQVPFANYENYSEMFVVALCQGERLQRPDFAPEKVYELMQTCWKHCPDQRPSFQCIETTLRSWAEESEYKLMTPPNESNKQPGTCGGDRNQSVNNVNYTSTFFPDEVKVTPPPPTSPPVIKGYVNEIPEIKAPPVQPPLRTGNTYVEWNAAK